MFLLYGRFIYGFMTGIRHKTELEIPVYFLKIRRNVYILQGRCVLHIVWGGKWAPLESVISETIEY